MQGQEMRASELNGNVVRGSRKMAASKTYTKHLTADPRCKDWTILKSYSSLRGISIQIILVDSRSRVVEELSRHFMSMLCAPHKKPLPRASTKVFSGRDPPKA